MTPKEIYEAAESAAKQAAAAENAKLPPENERGFDCGMAWVVIRPARGTFVAFCRQNGKGWRRDYAGGGWEIYKPGGASTQSISVHVAAAKAFAAVLANNGIEAVVGSRLD